MTHSMTEQQLGSLWGYVAGEKAAADYSRLAMRLRLRMIVYALVLTNWGVFIFYSYNSAMARLTVLSSLLMRRMSCTLACG